MNEQAIRKHEQHPTWSECAQCGQWFTNDSAFDLHLGPVPEKGPPVCRDPAKVRSGRRRLVLDAEYAVWHWEGLSIGARAERFNRRMGRPVAGVTHEPGAILGPNPGGWPARSV